MKLTEYCPRIRDIDDITGFLRTSGNVTADLIQTIEDSRSKIYEKVERGEILDNYTRGRIDTLNQLRAIYKD